MTHWYMTDEDLATAEANGINAKTLWYRKEQLGWERERAITEPPQARIFTDEIIQLAKENGIQYQTLRTRYKRGEDPVSAATRPPMGKKEKYALSQKSREKIPPEIRELAERNGIKYNTLYHRIMRQERDPVEAATTTAMTLEEVGQYAAQKRKQGRDGESCN